MRKNRCEMSNLIKIGFAGDVMIGRLVNEKISIADYDYPWGNVLRLLRKNGLNITNLETTLTKSADEADKIFTFKAQPDRVECLTRAGIGIVNIANNHILDFGEEGLIETIDVLDNAGVKHIGAGKNISEAKRPAIFKKNGMAVGIIGCTDNEPSWKAGEDKAGTNYLDIPYDFDVLNKDILALRNKVDIIVLSIHWGPNMRLRPSKGFRNFAHKCIDAGADIIHGHSAHIFQGVEVCKNKIIFYDTGDFVDDYAVDEFLRNDRSFLFNVHASKDKLCKIELVPVLISGMQVNKAKENDLKDAISRIKMLSKEFETRLEESDGKLILKLK